MNYYDLRVDERIPGWTLASPEREQYADGTPLDIWAFSRCEVFTGQVPVPFVICEKGKRVDWNLTPFGPIVVSDRLGDALYSLARDEIQLIPVELDAPGKWQVLNPLRCVDCIDHAESVIQYYPDDFPDETRAGTPRSIMRLRIRKGAAEGKHLFLPKDWGVVVIGSEMVKEMVSENGFTGIEFQKVT